MRLVPPARQAYYRSVAAKSVTGIDTPQIPRRREYDLKASLLALVLVIDDLFSIASIAIFSLKKGNK